MIHQNWMCSVALVGLLCGLAPRSDGVEVGATLKQPTRKATEAKQGNHADDSQALRAGRVTAVSARGDQVEIQGRWHRIDPNRTRIFRGGQAVQAEALKIGQTLKFTLTPGGGDSATLGAVYVP